MDVKLYMKLRKLKEGPLIEYKISKRIRPYGLSNKYNIDFDNEDDSFYDKSLFKRNIERKYSKKKNNSFNIKEGNQNSKNPMEEFAKTRFQIKRVNEFGGFSKRKEYNQSDLSLENENEENSNNENNILETNRYQLSNKYITERSLKKEVFSKRRNTFESNLNKKLKLEQILLEKKLLKKDLKEIRKLNKDLIKDNKILKLNNLEKANQKYISDTENVQKEKNYKIVIEDLKNKINQLERVIFEIQDAIKFETENNLKKNEEREEKIYDLEQNLSKYNKFIPLLKKNVLKIIKKNENNKNMFKEQNVIEKDMVIEKNLGLEYSLKNLINILKEFENN